MEKRFLNGFSEEDILTIIAGKQQLNDAYLASSVECKILSAEPARNQSS